MKRRAPAPPPTRSHAHTPTRRYDVHACILLCILACLFLYPVLLGRVLLPGDALLLMYPWRAHGPEKFPELYASGRFVPHNVLLDPIQQYYPWRKFATDSLRSGMIPLWNPYNFCGMPFVANGQSSVFYPLHFIFLIVGAEYGFGVSAIVHLSLIGIATYAFLRQLALREISAFVGAVTFMFCGFNVVWLEYPTVSLWTVVWLPVSLACIERAFAKSSAGWASLAGLALGMQFLAGHLQSGFYVLFCYTSYATYRSYLTHRLSLTPLFRFVALPLGLAFAVGAIQLLPSLELIGFNPRAAGKRYEDVIASALPVRQLITLIAPNFFGNPVDGGIYWGHFNYIEMTGYAGAVALMLAVVAMCVRRTPTTWFFFVLAVFSLLIATGSPLYRLMFMLPGFKQVAAVARIFVLFDFAVAALAAFGMERLIQDAAAPRLKAAGPLTAILLLSSLFMSAYYAIPWSREWLQRRFPEIDDSSWPPLGEVALMSCVLPAAAIIVTTFLLAIRGVNVRAARSAPLIVPLLVVAELWASGSSFNPSCPRSMLDVPPSLTELRQEVGYDRVISLVPSDAKGFVEVLPPNLNMLFGIRSAQGSDSLFPTWYAEVFEAAFANVLERKHAAAPPKAIEGDVYRETLGCLGVRYLMTVPASGDLEEFRKDENPYMFLRASVLSEKFGAQGGVLTPRNPEIMKAELTQDRSNTIVVSVPEARGQLRLADTYFPGWHAFADTEPLRIERVYHHALRAVPARAGTTTFVYLPTVFRVGAFVTMLTLTALVAAFAGARLSTQVARIPATVTERE